MKIIISILIQFQVEETCPLILLIEKLLIKIMMIITIKIYNQNIRKNTKIKSNSNNNKNMSRKMILTIIISLISIITKIIISIKTQMIFHNKNLQLIMIDKMIITDKFTIKSNKKEEIIKISRKMKQ